MEKGGERVGWKEAKSDLFSGYQSSPSSHILFFAFAVNAFRTNYRIGAIRFICHICSDTLRISDSHRHLFRWGEMY